MEGSLCSSFSSSLMKQEDSYKQRDVTASHVLRLGIHIFGDKESVCRRRLIDCETSAATRKSSGKGNVGAEFCKPEQFGASSAKTPDVPDIKEYSTWLTKRSALRADLDNFGISAQWLQSKQRTELEGSQLKKIKYRLLFRNEQRKVGTNISTVEESFCNYGKRTFSSLSAEHGKLASSMKTADLHQFIKLTSLDDVYMDRTVAEKGFLLPIDESKSSCQKSLPNSNFQSGVGCRRSSTTVVYSGNCNASSKVNCWQDADRYLKSESVENTRKTLIKKPDHIGKKIDSVFWPGVCLGKLRFEMYEDQRKVRSQNSIFQIVESKSTNFHKQRFSWPDNSKGYVQFGNISV